MWPSLAVGGWRIKPKLPPVCKIVRVKGSLNLYFVIRQVTSCHLISGQSGCCNEGFLRLGGYILSSKAEQSGIGTMPFHSLSH